MVPHHHEVGVTKIPGQGGAFILVLGHVLVVVVAHRWEDQVGMLAERQKAALHRADRHAGPGMGVGGESHVRPRPENGTVNEVASQVGLIVSGHRVAVEVHLDQIPCRDLVHQELVLLDQVVIRLPGHPGRCMGEGEVGPAEMRI